MEQNNRRRIGKIDRLNADTKTDVEQMILSGVTYREIVEYLKAQDVAISRQAVCTYAKRFLATTQMLRIAQDNFRMLTEELGRHPDVDTTEGIIHILSNSILNTLANTTPEDWQNISIDKLMREANSLIKVTAYKRSRRDPAEAAFQDVRNLIFKTMATENPVLFEQVKSFLADQQEKIQENGGEI
ncbi:MAG: DUF3486 family protein [Oscillospiraceae bacterium]|jgi:hypothetical protein|nr:DUF3486 family protein [Oscillospiraceae bacterium]